MASRIEQGVSRGEQITLTVNGKELTARAGESLATVLLLAGCSAFYLTRKGEPRAPFCNMGTCFECRVEVAGQGRVLACMSPAQEGMVVTTGRALPGFEGDDHAH